MMAGMLEGIREALAARETPAVLVQCRSSDEGERVRLRDEIRDRVRSLFSPLKAQAQYLRFVFLTGISKFSQLSVFSELNNLQQLTFDKNYEAVCGITEEEFERDMASDIAMLAEEYGCTLEEMHA